MSKILEALNRGRKRGESPDKFIQEELARTFFASSRKVKKKKITPKIWIMSGLIAFSIIFFAGYKILKKSDGIFFIKDGTLNNRLVKGISYYGDAAQSRHIGDMFVLVNSRGWGWANFSVQFKKPVNMEKMQLLYNARSEAGDERLVIVLIDAENRTYRIGYHPLKPLSQDWNYYSVNPIIAKSAIDISLISEIKFEFGGLTAQNGPAATIFLKDMRLAKREV